VSECYRDGKLGDTDVSRISTWDSLMGPILNAREMEADPEDC
jgi:hypothetical protein